MTHRNTHLLQADIAEDVRRRQEALQRLGQGASVAAGPSTARAALSVLHELAQAPETADKALALLHELQVHQIELDAQIESSRHALAEAELALRRCRSVHDLLPVACLHIDASACILASNRTACAWLGREASGLLGERLDRLLSPVDMGGLRERLAALQLGRVPAPWTLTLLRTAARPAWPVQAALSADEQPGHGLLVWMAAPPA